ncbi:MAG: HEPN domain-containing protein [Synergistaceae bacterium]|nr:HEPN domain-containing protein [Synergistaceae bacterium]
MSTFYFPCQFITFQDNELDNYQIGRYGINRRKYNFSIFDSSTLAVDHKLLNTPYQNMEIFFHNVGAELLVEDCESVDDARQMIEVLRLAMLVAGSSCFFMPYITNTRMDLYCEINYRSSENLRRYLSQESQEMPVPPEGSIEFSAYETYYHNFIFHGEHLIDKKFFEKSVAIAEKWSALEVNTQNLIMARKATSIAPIINDSSMCIMQIWQGIESFFTQNSELTFRLSLLIALLIGENRREVFENVKSQYKIRSKVAHGDKIVVNNNELVEAWNLLISIIKAVVVRGKLPTEDELMSEIFI